VKTNSIAQLLEDPGPFATAYVDVSRDMEDGKRVVELAVRGALWFAPEQGAPSSVCDEIRDLLTSNLHAEAPVSRAIVATERGVLLDEVSRARTVHATAAWAPLPDLDAWITDEETRVPFILALVDHEGGQVSVYRSSLRSADVTESVGKSFSLWAAANMLTKCSYPWVCMGLCAHPGFKRRAQEQSR
jgi:hypothetical protein